MRRKVRLSESDLRRIVRGSVKRVLRESLNVSEYEQLYDKIQEVSNEVTNFCGRFALEDTPLAPQTKMLMDRLSNVVSEMSDIAHELEEHLAWD